MRTTSSHPAAVQFFVSSLLDHSAVVWPGGGWVISAELVKWLDNSLTGPVSSLTLGLVHAKAWCEFIHLGVRFGSQAPHDRRPRFDRWPGDE